MHTYVVVVAKAHRAIHPDAVHQLTAGRPHLSFEPSATHTWSDPTGRVLVRSWECPNPGFGIDSYRHEDAAGLTAFVGHLWPRPDGWPSGEPWAAQLAARGRRERPEEQVAALAGVYSIVSLDARGQGHVVSDPLGFGSTYVAATEDFDVVSSRAEAAAWALAPTATPTRDPLGVAWLAYVGSPVGDRTGFAGVRTVPQGSAAEIDPIRGMRVRSWSSTPWRGDDEGASTPELVERVRAEIAGHLGATLALPGDPKVVGLTGGKDSRLVLAILLSEGLAGNVRYRTLGTADLPDVVVARQLAERYGLDHEWGLGRPRDERPYPVRARAFLRATGGARNLWDHDGAFGDEDGVTISGLLGEVLRTNYRATTGVETWDQVLHRFEDGLGFRRPGFLTPDAFACLHDEARAIVVADRGSDASPVDHLDAFYLNSRIRRWFGTASEIDRTNRVVPLYSLVGLRAAFALGGADRHAQLLHREVIRAAVPELADLPFAGSGWPTVAARRPAVAPAPAGPPPPAPGRVDGLLGGARWVARRVGIVGRPAPPPNPVRSIVDPDPDPDPAPPPAPSANRRHQARALPAKLPLLQEALGVPADAAVWQVIDRSRVVEALGRIDELAVPERVRLFGAATAALWLHDDVRRPRRGPGAEPGNH